MDLKISKISFTITYILVFLFLTSFVSAQENRTVEIRIMQHLCHPHITDTSTFADLAQDKDEMATYITALHSCPIVVLPSNTPIDGDEFHDAPIQRSFDFKIETESKDLAIENARFAPRKTCERHVSQDINLDGRLRNTVCLDSSYYYFRPVTDGKVAIDQTLVPGISRFGLYLFTPESGDEKTLFKQDGDTLIIDTTKDEDGIIVVHVFNFWGNDTNRNNEVIGASVLDNSAGSLRAYHGHGTATSNLDSYALQAVWIRDLNASLDGKRPVAEGILKINVGSKGEKFTLNLTESSFNRVEFNITGEDDPNHKGTLTLERYPYLNLTHWHGSLVINGGSYEGSYNVSLGTRSVLVEDTQRIDKLIEQRNRFTGIKSFFTSFLHRIGIRNS